VIEQPNPCCNPLIPCKVSKSSLRLPDPSSTSSISYQAQYPNPSPHQENPAHQPCPPAPVDFLERVFEMGEAETQRDPSPANHHQHPPSQQASTDSKAEAKAHQETAQVDPAKAAQKDEADPTGKAERPPTDQAVQVDQEDNPEAEDPGQEETVDVVPQVLEREQNQA